MRIVEYLKKPAVAALVGAILGLIVGLTWAWVFQPVQYTDVPPEQWGNYYREQYMRMAIDSYSVNNDKEQAQLRYQAVGSLASSELANIQANPGNQDMAKILAFEAVVQPGGVEVTPTPGDQPAPEARSKMAPIVIGGSVIAVVIILFVLARYILPLFRRTRMSTPTAAMRARNITQETEMTDYEAIGEEPPIAQFMTTYVMGDDLFDDSFSIESPAGEFMGECGVGISETIGVGEPKKVQAFEVWLFDKNDIQTVTKVLMSTHAFNDVATVQRLEAKGEPFLVERGKQVVLETAALQLVASITDMAYGAGPLPEESYFERLTLEIAVWPKPPA
jgi:hypothetical protein